MCVISPLTLLPRIAQGEIIRNLSTRDVSRPEGAGFDLRLSEVYELNSPGYLGIEERNTSAVSLLASANEDSREIFRFVPQEYYLVTTKEEVSLDSDMVAFVHPRSSLLRSGVALVTAVTAPGYKGMLTFGLHVAGRQPFIIELGARFAHINFFRLDRPANDYEGQWQGGRVAAPEREEQS